MAQLRAQDIPDYLLEDEHVREEFGVNQFTTPSIRKIFEDLNRLRPLPYHQLQRSIPTDTPTDRTLLALRVGSLLADGFFAVEAEQFLDLEPVGRALIQHAKVLGSGTRVSSHLKSMLEDGAISDWDGLRGELARTQADVEKEMVLIRDVDAANLISLGGWLRGFEIGCAAAVDPYAPEKAQILGRKEVVGYFLANLETLAPPIRENEAVLEIEAGLSEIAERIDIPEQEVLSEPEILELLVLVEKLVDYSVGSQRILEEGEVSPPPSVTSAPTDPSKDAPEPTGGVISGEVAD
ncbi:MAG: hypothetical protein AAF236_08975 [Verrucomicrobiota bacterium]